MPSDAKVKLLMEAVEDRLALDPVLLDLTGKVLLFDYAIICAGNSDTHIRAITNGVLEKTDEANLPDPRVEGQSVGEWILMDYGDIVIHILSEEARQRYKLETFWSTPQPKGALPPSPDHPDAIYAGGVTADGFNESDEDDFDEDEDEMTDEEIDALDIDDEDEDIVAFFDQADQEVEPVDEEDDLDTDTDEDETAPKPRDGK
jgi:ribosome-associated protein